MQKHILGDSRSSLNSINSNMMLHRLPPLGLVIKIMLNIGCNARCIMCDGRRHDPGGEFDYSSVVRIVSNLDGKTVAAVKLLGGEPLLDKSGLLVVVKICKTKGIEAFITTNGSLLDRPFVDKLVLLGVKEITLSLDAIGPTHDRIRRIPGLSDKIQRMILHINKRYPFFKIKVNTVVMRTNYKEIPGLVVWAGRSGIYSLSLLDLVDYNNNYKDLKVGYREQIQLFRRLKDSPVKIDFVGYPQRCVKGHRCHYLLNNLNIRDDGKIVPCYRFDNNPFFLDKQIKDLYKTEAFRKYILKKALTCSECLMLND